MTISNSSLVRYDEEGQVAEVIDPASGSLVDLRAAATDDLIELRQTVRMAAQDAGRALDDELMHRLDRANRKSVHVGGWTLSVTPAEELEWDVDGLSDELWALESEGLLDPEACTEAIESVPATRRVKAVAAKRLLDHPLPEVRQRIAVYARTRPKRRSLSVRRG